MGVWESLVGQYTYDYQQIQHIIALFIYQNAFVCIIMKNDLAYSRQKIQKYLKFKKNDRNTSNNNQQTSKTFTQNPPVNKSCTAALQQSHAQMKKSILDRLDEVKQKYLKKGEKKKEEPKAQASIIYNQTSLTWQHNKTIQVNNQRKNELIMQQNDIKANNSNHQQTHAYNGHKSSIVHDIILKRLKESFQESLSTTISQEQEQRDDQIIESEMINKQEYLKALRPCINIPFDQEYTDARISSAENVIIESKSRSIEQQIRLWMHQPNKPISQILTIPSSSLDFVFTSTNKAFSPAIAQIITQFVLKGKCEMKQSQKQALYHMGIQYFYGNASELTAELLFILTKLGKRYLVQNSQYFATNTQRYCKIIFKNRSLFSIQERANVVNFLVQHRNLKHIELGCLLMVLPTQKLVQNLLAKPFSKGQTIFLLACLNLARKEYSYLIEPYLRLVSTFLDGITLDRMLIEEILAHVGEITPGDSYQIHKQTKLKLIRLLSEGQSVNQNKTEKGEKTSSKIIGYWSKAVDKIKIATQHKE